MTEVTVTALEQWLQTPGELLRALREALVPDSVDIGQASGALAPMGERLTLTVEEAATLLGISRAFAYEAVNAGTIPSIRIGRRVLVPKVALERLLAGA